jgi:4-amino-4-deoxy-L-arabinose transferase-like glycosyltransferase
MFGKFYALSKNQQMVIVMILVGVIAFMVGSNILDAFFSGEDEAMYIRLCGAVSEYIRRGDLRNVYFALLYHDHPPLPILMVTPFIYLMGYNEAALRMPSVLLWVVSCLVAARVGYRLGGVRVGFLSGIFLAVSGIFDILALGFGEAAEVLFVLLFVGVLLDNFEWNLDTPPAQKKYLWGGIYLAAGYLFYSSTLPVIVAYHLIFGFKMLKAEFNLTTFWRYVQFTVPFAGFYLIYNAIFLGIPAYDVYVFGFAPYGQLRQNLGRAGASLNIDSMFVNLRVMNAYVLPFISWIILAFGMYAQLRKNVYLFVILAGYGAIWSFYLQGNTGQHFLAYFCWAVPFGIAYIDQLFRKRNNYVFSTIWLAILGLMVAWTYAIHLKTYTYDSYPRDLVSAVWGENLGWINNIYRPLRKIVGTLNDNLGSNGKYLSLVDGALTLYYYPDESRSLDGTSHLKIRQDKNGRCFWLPADVIKANKLRAVVSYVNQDICPELVEVVNQYPGSNLQLTILKR